MINLTQAEISRLALHRIGSQETGIEFSKQETALPNPEVKDLFLHYFLSGFKSPDYYHFTHHNNLEMNPVFYYCSQIFEKPDMLFECSQELVKHLYEVSDHPNIKEGDFGVAFLENCDINGEYSNALAIFKIESKDPFLKIGDDFSISPDLGIYLEKMDKACLVFELEKEKGFVLKIEDRTNKQEARYWKDDFLQTSPREDAFFHTKNYLQLCKNFCSEILEKQEHVEKTDQIDFLNRSAGFFNKKEIFNIQEFEDEVIAEPRIIDRFRNFKNQFEETHELDTFDEFDISPKAAKSARKIFKSVLKLDKNFHIYIHGNREMIEKGFDEEKGLNYYKVYFREEKD